MSLKYFNTAVTFSEVPEEVTLCIELSNCPFNCEGCHSPYLKKDVGVYLTEKVLKELIKQNKGITCVAFMGGDSDIENLIKLLAFIKEHTHLKVCWYTGRLNLPEDKANTLLYLLDYVKFGPYIKELGGLDKKTTNQKFYKLRMWKEQLQFIDITNKFSKHEIKN